MAQPFQNNELDFSLIVGAVAIVAVTLATGLYASGSQGRQENPQAISATNSARPSGVTVGSATVRPSEQQSPVGQ